MLDPREQKFEVHCAPFYHLRRQCASDEFVVYRLSRESGLISGRGDTLRTNGLPQTNALNRSLL
jgi:hypothetical protein